MDDRRSTLGYCNFVWGTLVTWRSKKQNVVARSSAEVEFRAMAHGICELIWLRRISGGLEIKSAEPMRLYCDNKVAIGMAHKLKKIDISSKRRYKISYCVLPTCLQVSRHHIFLQKNCLDSCLLI